MAPCGTPRVAKPPCVSTEFRASSPQAHIWGVQKLVDNSRFSYVLKSHQQDTRTTWRNAQISPLTSSGRSLVSVLFVGRDDAANRSRTGNQNAYLVKRRSGGGVMFSRDPMNLTNKHSRTHAGFINEKAVGIQPNDKGGVDLVTKKPTKSYQPGQHHHKVSIGKGTSNQK